ncbi:uncharacterized protein LOC108208495 [Daucus carota subsp. sativus]|uniref:uncharacterized protein LOC108208495 n=1 Tax=Daucus carota subsp. sativus TaxID=79200 RepID=UPI00308397A7
MTMWSYNYPNYERMLCNSSPGASYADYLLPVAFDSEYYNYHYYYYPSTSISNNIILLNHQQHNPYHYRMDYPSVPIRNLFAGELPLFHQSVPIRSHRAHPHPYRASYPVRSRWARRPDPAPCSVRPRRACRARPDPAPFSVRPRRAHPDYAPCPVRPRQADPHRAPCPPCPVRPRRVRVLAPRRRRNNTRSCGLNVQFSLQVSKVGNQRRVFRNPSCFRGLAQGRTTTYQGSRHLGEGKGKRSRNFPMRTPLQVSSLPKTRRIRYPSHFQASAFKKRKRSHARTKSSFQAPAFQKRSYKQVPLRVSNQRRKRSHKFKKWFPLRVSNQWRKRSHRSYACFRCKKQGHFAIRCPLNLMHNKSRIPSPVPVFVGEDGLQYSPPSLICQCGLRCLLKFKKFQEKTSRKAFTCSLRSCRIFRWEDEVNKDELISVPKCQCGAGFCRQCTESGRKYFACPIKKGQGACTFFKLLNDESLINNKHVDERITPPNLTVGDCTGTFPVNSVQKESRSSCVPDTVKRYPKQRKISGNQKLELMEMELECEEDASSKTLRKCHKRFRNGAPKYDRSFLQHCR